MNIGGFHIDLYAAGIISDLLLLVLDDLLSQGIDLLPEKGCLADRDLKSVVLAWIVRPCDHHRSIGPVSVDLVVVAKVVDRCGYHPHIQDLASCRIEP